MSGQGMIRFKDPDRTVLTVGPGDVVYLPARLPSRIIPTNELLQVRPAVVVTSTVNRPVSNATPAAAHAATSTSSRSERCRTT